MSSDSIIQNLREGCNKEMDAVLAVLNSLDQVRVQIREQEGVIEDLEVRLEKEKSKSCMNNVSKAKLQATVLPFLRAQRSKVKENCHFTSHGLYIAGGEAYASKESEKLIYKNTLGKVQKEGRNLKNLINSMSKNGSSSSALQSLVRLAGICTELEMLVGIEAEKVETKYKDRLVLAEAECDHAMKRDQDHSATLRAVSELLGLDLDEVIEDE